MLLLLSVLAAGVRAQAVGEWLQQKKTQQAYLVEQLAALRLYAGYAQQSYAITREGLGAIGSGKEGEFGLHKEYFRSLGQVSPAVRQYWKVAAVLALREEVVQVCLHTRQQVQESGVFSVGEAAYVRRVTGALLEESAGVQEELLAVTTPERLGMEDEERLRRVDAAHSLLLEQLLLARRFAQETLLLAAARLQEQHERKKRRILHGITPDVP